jgi:hypothetical protein
MDVLMEHTVMFVDFKKWLDRKDNHPMEDGRREHIRKILSLG